MTLNPSKLSGSASKVLRGYLIVAVGIWVAEGSNGSRAYATMVDGVPGASQVASSVPPPQTACGQSCNYQKANDNVTLQSRYVLRKLDLLKSMLADPEDKTDDVLKNLGDFCTASEIAARDAQKCFDRYKHVQISALHKMRNSIGSNEDMIARLNGRRALDERGNARTDGQVREEAVAVASEVQSGGHVPEVMTLKEIELELKKNPSSQRVKQSDYLTWLKNAGNPPQLSDFPKFVDQPRDPGNPSAGSLSMILRDAHGNPVYDKEAFDRAKKSFDDRLSAKAPGGGVNLNDAEDEVLKSKTPLARKVPEKESQDEYNIARYEIVSGANRVISGKHMNAKDLTFKKGGTSQKPGQPAVLISIDPNEKVDAAGAKDRNIHLRYKVDDLLEHIEEASN